MSVTELLTLLHSTLLDHGNSRPPIIPFTPSGPPRSQAVPQLLYILGHPFCLAPRAKVN